MMQCHIVATHWLAEMLDLDMRFCFSMHDELIYRCAKAHAKLGAYAVQLAHAWGWTLLHYNLGVYDMPCIRAFAEGVHIDAYTWRKSPKASSHTHTFAGHPPCKSYGFGELIAQGISERIAERWAQKQEYADVRMAA